MAFGLQIFSANDAINPIFDSTVAFGFIELQDDTVLGTGSAVDNYAVIVDDGYTEVFPVYAPDYVNPNLNSANAHLVTNSRTPIFTVGTRVDNGNGTATFNLSLAWEGQGGDDGTGSDENRIGGGRVLIFGR